MISVVATLKVNEGREQDFIDAAKEMIAAVAKNEAGRTLMYTLQQAQDDPTTFVFYEQYADAEAIAAHGKTEHMAAFGGRLRGVTAGRPQVQRFEIVDALSGA